MATWLAPSLSLVITSVVLRHTGFFPPQVAHYRPSLTRTQTHSASSPWRAESIHRPVIRHTQGCLLPWVWHKGGNMRQSGVGQSRGCAPPRSCVRSWATAPCVVSSTEVCVPTADDALEAGGYLGGHVESHPSSAV